jgi:hypothetical protein
MSNRFWDRYSYDIIPGLIVLGLCAVIVIPLMALVASSNRDFDAKERKAQIEARTPENQEFVKKVMALHDGNIVLLTKCENGSETIGYVDAGQATVTVWTKYGLCQIVDLNHMQDVLPFGRKITKVVRYGDPDYAKTANQILSRRLPPPPKDTWEPVPRP